MFYQKLNNGGNLFSGYACNASINCAIGGHRETKFSSGSKYVNVFDEK